MEWPSCSPDLNPIENLWGDLARRVYANHRQFKNVAELKKAITQAWSEVDLGRIENLVNSMPNRVFEVIKKKGGVIKY